MSYALTIGFITYGKFTAKYLPYFLSSLKEQTFKDFNILVFDNTEEADNENELYIRNNYPEIKIARGNGNLGFAAACNRLINKARNGGAEYFLALNPDMILEPAAVEKMAKALDEDRSSGSVCPKILKWDFNNKKKTNIIDSCGIVLKSGLRFFDLGQGQVDVRQFDKADILGPSGAAAMYRISALEKAKENDQYFNELMFMYKEDCDLAYRLFLTGYRSKLVADAVIYHDRTTYGKGEGDLRVAFNRKNKSRQVKKWAFLHQQIIFIKYWKLQSFWNKLAIVWYEFKIIVFIILFEQYLLGELLNLWKIKKEIICH